MRGSERQRGSTPPDSGIIDHNWRGRMALECQSTATVMLDGVAVRSVLLGAARGCSGLLGATRRCSGATRGYSGTARGLLGDCSRPVSQLLSRPMLRR